MRDRYIVIEALEKCVSATDECWKCPYNREARCTEVLKRDALDHLRTRVLNYDELEDNDIVFLEHRRMPGYEHEASSEMALPRTSKYHERKGITNFTVEDDGSWDCALQVPTGEYNKTWRCWNHEPSKNLMIQTAWDEVDMSEVNLNEG